MSAYDTLRRTLQGAPRRFLVTGAAGFIGSNLVEALLQLGQEVVGLDNFATGHQRNLDQVRESVGDAWARFRFIEGDITDLATCQDACRNSAIVLHQAALGSVPRSLQDPIATNRANVDGFLNMLVASKDQGIARFVYAASSSTYGDHPGLPKIEERIGEPLSPYAVTKYVNELYAKVFARNYGLQAIGLRYFNVFGRRQDPFGAYAAVIPKWVAQMLGGEPCAINGDGETSRDFCYIENVIQANLLAATTEDPAALDQIYNVAYGGRTTLNELHALLKTGLERLRPGLAIEAPLYRPERAGDVRHSQASIEKAARLLGYQPTHSARQGLDEALAWYAASPTIQAYLTPSEAPERRS